VSGPVSHRAHLLDGAATAAAIKGELRVRVAALAARGVVPGLGTVLVGDDPGSRAYVNGKHRDCAEVGIFPIRADLPATATQDEIEAAVTRLNADPACTGFIVQLPLPAGVDTNRVLELIDPAKDADGLHPTNLGRLVLRVTGPMDSPLPCTPRGILELLARHGIALAGLDVVVVVSAMGKATDGLLDLARNAAASGSAAFDPPRRELDMLLSTGERVSIQSMTSRRWRSR